MGVGGVFNPGSVSVGLGVLTAISVEFDSKASGVFPCVRNWGLLYLL